MCCSIGVSNQLYTSILQLLMHAQAQHLSHTFCLQFYHVIVTKSSVNTTNGTTIIGDNEYVGVCVSAVPGSPVTGQ